MPSKKKPIFPSSAKFPVVGADMPAATDQEHINTQKSTTQYERIKQLEAEIEHLNEVRNRNILLLQNNLELQENNKELNSFSYVTSHDLQEPLRKISTFSKLIAKDKTNILSEDSALYLERIIASVNRLKKLTDDLLNYSHISNTNENNFEDTDLNFLINDSINELKENIDIKKNSIKVDHLPILKVIPFMMRQLFINILSNSFKYCKTDVIPCITITCSFAKANEVNDLGGQQNTGYYKIIIKDNGIGFPQQQALRIFEPFQRLHAKDKYEGTGIGLAICKKIILKHKGFITAKSTLGTGASFIIYLPIS